MLFQFTFDQVGQAFDPDIRALDLESPVIVIILTRHLVGPGRKDAALDRKLRFVDRIGRQRRDFSIVPHQCGTFLDIPGRIGDEDFGLVRPVVLVQSFADIDFLAVVDHLDQAAPRQGHPKGGLARGKRGHPFDLDRLQAGLHPENGSLVVSQVDVVDEETGLSEVHVGLDHSRHPVTAEQIGLCIIGPDRKPFRIGGFMCRYNSRKIIVYSISHRTILLISYNPWTACDQRK